MLPSAVPPLAQTRGAGVEVVVWMGVSVEGVVGMGVGLEGVVGVGARVDAVVVLVDVLVVIVVGF